MLALVVAMTMLQAAPQPTCRNADLIAETTRDTLRRVQPMMEERRAILKRLSDLQAGNPISRGLGSLFDRNKDPAYLRERANLLGEQIRTELASGQVEVEALKLGC